MKVLKKTLVPELRFPEFSGEWEEKKLGKLVSFKKGKGIPKSDLREHGTKCILYGQLYTTYSEIIEDVNSYTDINNEDLLFGEVGDILIPSSGETALDMSLASALFVEGVALGGDINILRPKKNLVNSKFLSYQINSTRKIDLAKIAEGASVVHIYNSNLESVTIINPTDIKEQTKIANFFTLIGEKIEKQEEKIANLEDYKKGMIQKIFSQEIRLKDDNGEDYPEWEQKRLGEVFKERNERGQEELELLSVTLNQGVIRRTDIEAKDNSSTDKSIYKIVELNDIAYNSMRMWQGASGVSKFRGIVSPAYTVLTPRKNIDSNYFGYAFKTELIINEFRKYSQGLTSDTWNLKYPLLKQIKINVPCFKEQEKIANFISSLDVKIEKEMKKLDSIKELKKGFMQKMFI